MARHSAILRTGGQLVLFKRWPDPRGTQTSKDYMDATDVSNLTADVVNPTTDAIILQDVPLTFRQNMKGWSATIAESALAGLNSVAIRWNVERTIGTPKALTTGHPEILDLSDLVKQGDENESRLVIIQSELSDIENAIAIIDQNVASIIGGGGSAHSSSALVLPAVLTYPAIGKPNLTYRIRLVVRDPHTSPVLLVSADSTPLFTFVDGSGNLPQGVSNVSATTEITTGVYEVSFEVSDNGIDQPVFMHFDYFYEETAQVGGPAVTQMERNDPDTIDTILQGIFDIQGDGYVKEEDSLVAQTDNHEETQAAIAALSFGAGDFQFNGPTIIEKPTSGPASFTIALTNFDNHGGGLLDADALPSISIAGGAVPGITNPTVMTKLNTGVYTAQFTVSDTVQTNTNFTVRVDWDSDGEAKAVLHPMRVANVLNRLTALQEGQDSISTRIDEYEENRDQMEVDLKQLLSEIQTQVGDDDDDTLQEKLDFIIKTTVGQPCRTNRISFQEQWIQEYDRATAPNGYLKIWYYDGVTKQYWNPNIQAFAPVEHIIETNIDHASKVSYYLDYLHQEGTLGKIIIFEGWVGDNAVDPPEIEDMCTIAIYVDIDINQLFF